MAEQNKVDDSAEIPPVGPCQSYRPGHQSHWIMVQMYRSAPSRSAVVCAAQGSAITLQVGQEILTWHHHEPARLVVALRQLPRTVRILEQCTSILVNRRGSTFWFNCAPQALDECTINAP